MTGVGLDAGVRLARQCGALGHPARVVIIRHLIALGRACTLADLHARLPLAQSTVSQHVAVLVAAGLVRSERRRPRTFYRADAAALADFRRAVAGL